MGNASVLLSPTSNSTLSGARLFGANSGNIGYIAFGSSVSSGRYLIMFIFPLSSNVATTTPWTFVPQNNCSMVSILNNSTLYQQCSVVGNVMAFGPTCSCIVDVTGPTAILGLVRVASAAYTSYADAWIVQLPDNQN